MADDPLTRRTDGRAAPQGGDHRRLGKLEQAELPDLWASDLWVGVIKLASLARGDFCHSLIIRNDLDPNIFNALCRRQRFLYCKRSKLTGHAINLHDYLLVSISIESNKQSNK